MDEGALVELVGAGGRTRGTAPKLAAHRPPGALHRAVSVFLTDPGGRLLVQRRAQAKYHSAGLWSNTCCTHPLPGEAPAGAAARRLGEELGVVPVGLAAAGAVVYRVTDPLSGLVEHEWNHLFVGRAAGDPEPDPGEVEDWAWVPLEPLTSGPPAGYTAWFPVVLAAALPGLRDLDGNRGRP